MTDASPTTIAVVSGKGGVGKTMLAVAIARELSKSRRTLILDLDFFNRGLSGLLKAGKEISVLDRPDFLKPEGSNKRVVMDWKLMEITDNLFYVNYSDIPEDEITSLDTYSAEELSHKIREFIINTAAVCNFDSVVLDCHGGPDITSFASCLIADHTLLISEPDRITLFGTLHFLRKLYAFDLDKKVNVHLVFNKVVKDFSPLFLQRVYKEELKKYFGGKKLLAIYPLEVYLTKAFEKNTFLTDSYPNSVLTRNTQLLLRDLLFRDKKELLTQCIIKMPWIMRLYRRYTLGRTMTLINTDNVVITVFSLGMILFTGIILKMLLVPLGEDSLFLTVMGKVGDFLVKYHNELSSGIVLWVVISFVSSWTTVLERQMSFDATNRNISRLITKTFLLIAIWLLPAAFPFYLFLLKSISSKGNNFIAVLFTGLSVTIWAGILYRGYRYYRFAGKKIDPIARFFAAGCLTCWVIILFLGRHFLQS